MAKAYYIENGSVKPITGIRVGVNNTARFVKKGWVGVNGVAHLCYYQELVAIPVLSGTYIYDGSEQTVTISNLDTSKVNVSGTLKATNAGTYQITFSLKSRLTVWADHTQGDKVFIWTINKIIVSIPDVSSWDIRYDGTVKQPVITGFDSNTMIMGGTTEAINVGQYIITFALKDPVNYAWTDGTSSQKDDTWSLQVGILIPPVVTSATTFNYDGQPKSLTFSGYDDSTMYMDGDITATNIGEKATWIYLKDSANYKWSDVLTPYVGYFWEIDKAAGFVSASPNYVSLDGTYGTTVTCIITGSSNNLSDYSVEYDHPLSGYLYKDDYDGKIKLSLSNYTVGAYNINRTARVKLRETENYTAASTTITAHIY